MTNQLQDRVVALEEQQGSYDREQQIVSARLDDLLLRVRTIERGMERVETVQAEHTKRFDAIDERFDTIDERFGRLESEFSSMKTLLTQVLERLPG
ncbi:MAG: hypothetical protein F6K42_14915 [Leptolyngbya sp. SIO1D8]|nr:hypothetical protein [Leptolyngbya sp. SIO1D8]